MTGARQVGKSTLARLVLERVGGTYLTLDDPLTLAEATQGANRLVARARSLIVIDEARRAFPAPAGVLAADAGRGGGLTEPPAVVLHALAERETAARGRSRAFPLALQLGEHRHHRRLRQLSHGLDRGDGLLDAAEAGAAPLRRRRSALPSL